MMSRSPLLVAKEHGHRILTMLTVYAWTEGWWNRTFGRFTMRCIAPIWTPVGAERSPPPPTTEVQCDATSDSSAAAGPDDGGFDTPPASSRGVGAQAQGRDQVDNGAGQNPYLAWAFFEAAHFAIQYLPAAKGFYERKRQRQSSDSVLVIWKPTGFD
jgi:hypothetical protein